MLGLSLDEEGFEMIDAAEFARQYLKNVHSPEQCHGRPCTIHNPTDHPMRSWDLIWREDRGFFERLCPIEGCAHPDPDTVSYWELIATPWESVHGCCGHGH